jgi:hypothetical protein
LFWFYITLIFLPTDNAIIQYYKKWFIDLKKKDVVSQLKKERLIWVYIQVNSYIRSYKSYTTIPIAHEQRKIKWLIGTLVLINLKFRRGKLQSRVTSSPMKIISTFSFLFHSILSKSTGHSPFLSSPTEYWLRGWRTCQSSIILHSKTFPFGHRHISYWLKHWSIARSFT